MRKIGLASLLVAVLLLGACSSNTPIEGTEQDSSVSVEEQEQAEAEETEATAVISEEEEATPISIEASGPASCQPFSLAEQILPEPSQDLPPVTDEDWVLGPDDARITILEYSEFQ